MSASRLRFALLTAAGLTAALATLPLPAMAADLLIENVTVVSPELSAPLAKRWVHVRDGRITAIAAQPIAVPAHTARLNGAGKYLTPGLMDSHVHVSVPAGLPFGESGPAMEQLRADYHRQQPRSYLYFGVTQLLDPLGFAEGIAAYQAQPQKPDLFRCGAAAVLNGYPRIEAHGEVHTVAPEFIIEPANRDPIPAGVDPAAHTPEAVVARIAASGARCVKIFIENGFGNASHLPILQPATVARVRTAAHKAGLSLVAHANALDMQRLAVAANVDVIAHGMWNWSELDQQPGMPAPIAELLQRVQTQQIGYQPTQRVIAGLLELFRADTLNDPVLNKVTPASVLAFYRSEPGKFFQAELRSDFAGAPDARIQQRFEQIGEQGRRVVKQLHDLGHPLLLASDTPSAPVYANQPGYNSYQELRAMAAAGVPLDAVLRAGTINNAKQFGLDKDYGSVEVGKIANLLLLDGNPLKLAEAWNQIHTVVLHGKAIARETLTVEATGTTLSVAPVASEG